MNATLYGPSGGPVVALVGAWDPLMPSQQQLFRQFATYAHAAGLTSAAILLDPHPASLIPESPMEWPHYDDVRRRIALIGANGIDTVLVVHFQVGDLDAPLDEFFRMVGGQVRIEELFLGQGQTLGRGPEASNEVLERLAGQLGIQLYRLPPAAQSKRPFQVRNLVRQGRLADAIRLVGRAPAWHRPADRLLRLAWPPGRYVLHLTGEPPVEEEAVSCQVELADGAGGLPTLSWPDERYEWATFTAGPSDLTESQAQRADAPFLRL